LAIILSMILIGAAAAEEEMPGPDFRVDNGIFKMGKTEPVSRTVTIFADGKVYDFMLDTQEIVIYNEQDGSFTLINISKDSKGVQTVLTKQLIDQAIERLMQRATNEKDPRTQFLYNPKFAPLEQDAMTGQLIFKSPWLTYRVKTKLGGFKMAKRYYRFADAYARLNTITSPGGRPPFARMLVNKTLGESSMLPQTILLTNGEESDPKAARFRSEHRYEMKLEKSSQERIEKVKESLKNLKVVPLEEYMTLLESSSQS
jgi:hypothetical protein